MKPSLFLRGMGISAPEISRFPSLPPGVALPDTGKRRVYGPRHIPNYNNVLPIWTYDDLVAQGGRGGIPREIHDFNNNRDLLFYPSPQDYANHVTICTALHEGFTRGLTIPWVNGAYDIAPGVYFPDKSWADMVMQSDSIRRGEQGSQWNCSTLIIYNPNHRPATFCSLNSGGGAFTGEVSSTGRSAIIPSNNRWVLETAARWAAKYGDVSRYNLLCTGQTSTKTVMDPGFGHSYKQTTTEQLLINQDGTTSVVNKTDTSPILTEQYGKGGVSGAHQYTADSLRADIAAGQFPRDAAHITRMFWNDTGVETTPAAVMGVAAGGGGGAPPGAATTDWGKYIGYGGLAVGGILLLSALTKK